MTYIQTVVGLGISEPSTVCIHILKHLQLKVEFFLERPIIKLQLLFANDSNPSCPVLQNLRDIYTFGRRSIELALCTTSNISCSPPGQPILAFTVDLIATSGLGSAGIYTACQKQHFHERVKHHILWSSITFYDLFKTYDIYNYNQHKDSKTWLIQHAPPHPFLHHECLTQNRIRHMKKPCRRLLRPFVGDAGEGVLHVQPGIKVGYQPTLLKKNNTCRLVVLFEKTQKTVKI